MRSLCSEHIDMFLHFVRRWNRRRKHIKSFLRSVLGKDKSILMSENDYYRLLETLRKGKTAGYVKKTLLAKFRIVIRNTDVKALRQIPRDIITMNSRFEVLTGRGKIFTLRLVYPGESNKKDGLISILSWMGICLIGKREGYNIRYNLRIHKITYQPEANDDFHL